MSIFYFVCRQVEVSATGRSLVQRTHTSCGSLECDPEISTRRRPGPTGCVKTWKSDKVPVPAHNVVLGIEVMVSLILNMGILDGCKWPASNPDRLVPSSEITSMVSIELEDGWARVYALDTQWIPLFGRKPNRISSDAPSVPHILYWLATELTNDTRWSVHIR